jgi:hypothetical protein
VAPTIWRRRKLHWGCSAWSADKVREQLSCRLLDRSRPELPAAIVGNNRQPTALAVNFLADKLQANKGLLPDPWDPTAASIGNTAYATLAVAPRVQHLGGAGLVGEVGEVAGGYLRSTVNGKPPTMPAGWRCWR